METTALLPTIQNFFSELNQDPFLKQHNQDHERQSSNANKLLQIDYLDKITKEELQEFLMDTDAWLGVRSGPNFWIRLFGSEDEKLPSLRESLIKLISQAEIGLNSGDIAPLLEPMHGIGLAFLSELLTFRFPEKYWMWNTPVRKFFAAQNIDIKNELPWGKKGDPGEEYLAVGKHLEELRRFMSRQFGENVDFLLTDLFIYWANKQQEPSDPWVKRIRQWISELDPKRLQTRLVGEQNARKIVESRLGQFTEQDLQEFAKELNADFYKGVYRYDRFKPAFYGPQVNKLVQSLSAFNHWAKRIWEATDKEIDGLLDKLWSTEAVYGGGITFPTVLLYLKDPKKYNIWLVNSTKGLNIAKGFQSGKWRKASSYRLYNQEMNDFRSSYSVTPQAVDYILWLIASQTSNSGDSQFMGFVQDTFIFLKELEQNNNDEWMHANNDANLTRYRTVLKEPLRSLFTTVAPMIQQMDPGLETEAKVNKVLAIIRKRFADVEGPYHPYLWGAYYRKGRTKQTDCQLFVNVHPSHINVGLSVAGAQGADIHKRFLNNLKNYPQFFLSLLHSLPAGFHIRLDDKNQETLLAIESIISDQELTPFLKVGTIDIEKRFKNSDPILLKPEFSELVKEIFQSLYPLYQFILGSDETIAGLLEDLGEGEEEEPEERYGLENLIIDTYLPGEFWTKINILLADKGQIVFYGPPGTGKTWVAEKYAQYWVDQAKEFGGEVRVVQFHPSYSYEEFVEGIRPESVDGPGETKQVTYPVKTGIFRRFCAEASQHPNRRYVMIIDEINRGELPRILGELLYLLEYRTKSVELPYSGSQGEFGIPSNVFLIGTMNTADRSIALVDHALRRRFYFVPMKADAEILRSFLLENQPGMEWVADLLTVLNKKLENEAKIEWALHIGHSHFMKKELDDLNLRLIWEHSVMPTLQEYFYRRGESYIKEYSLDTLRASLGK